MDGRSSGAAVPAGLAVVAAVAGVVLTATVGAAIGETGMDQWSWGGAGVLNVVVGAVIVTRHRASHRLGWLFVAAGLAMSLGGLAEITAVAVTVRGLDLPGGTAAAWVSAWYWIIPMYAGIVFLPLLFPTGRTLSPAWGRLARVAAVVGGATAVLAMLTRDLLVEDGDLTHAVENPVGVLPASADDLAGVIILPVLAFTLAALASLVVRYRRASPAERRQFAWVAVGMGTLCVYYLGLTVVGGVTASGQRPPVLDLLVQGFLPVSIGLAIVRYRLYDIDRIVSRSVSYLLVTGVLLAVYALVALVPAQLVGRGGETPDLLVACATLLVAVLFRPLGTRVQRVVDRRFNRRRYDAVALVAAMASRLRDELELPTMTRDLRDTVASAVEPSDVSVWLPDPTRP